MRPCMRASMPNEGGAVVLGSRGPCVAVRGRVFRVQKPRAGAPLALPPRPPLLRARKTRSSSPPSLVGKKKKKKRRSLAHRNVGREGSRGPHHTTPHRGASSAIAAFYPPGTPSLCRCCTHPYRALASTSLVSSLGFSALVFSGFSAAGPPRDCQTRKKKKKKLF